MKASQITKGCAVCSGALGSVFFRVRVDHAVLDARAFDQVGGLERLLRGGNASSPTSLRIAEALAPDAEVVKFAGDMKPSLVMTVLLCTTCACTDAAVVAALNASEKTESTPG